MSSKKMHPVVRQSSLNMLWRCGIQYHRRYDLGEIMPPGIAMLRGSSFHAGAAHNLSQKIASGVDLPVKEIVDFAVTDFTGRINQGYFLTPDEKAIGAKKVIAETKDSLPRFCDAFCSVISPRIQPVWVEEEITIELPEKCDLSGILDCATKDTLYEFKTRSRRPPERDVHIDPQLTFYAMLFRFKAENLPSHILQENVIDRKGAAEVVGFETTRRERDIVMLINRVNNALKVIEAQAYVPAPPTAWWCDERFCGYALSCPYYTNPRKRQEERESAERKAKTKTE